MIGKITSTSIYNNQASNSVASPSAAAERARVATQTQKSSDAFSKPNDQSTRVTISDEALNQYGSSKESSSKVNNASSSNQSALSSEDLNELSELKNRDREVRAHEMAHVMAGGSLVRKGASYQYEVGPDGVRYAVSGEVSIDTSPVEDDPAATIAKMERVKRAALAPAEPSSQDRSVAASASQTEAAARQELVQESSSGN